MVNNLIESGKIKFYARYVDDTLLLVKPEDVNEILARFNSFHKNIEFTVDKFEDCVPHFLDLEIHPDGLSIFRKETHTAQFVHFQSFTKWNHKIAWIRSLVTRAKRLCSVSKLKSEIKSIRRFASYNGFPRWVVNKTIKQSLRPSTKRSDDEDQERVELYMFLPYFGKEAENTVERTTKRLFKLFKKDKKVIFKIQLQTTKLSFFSSNKDRTPLLSHSSLVYRYSCPGCNASYIGKTESTLFNRTKEHGWTDVKSAINKHFTNCTHWNEITDLFRIDGGEVDIRQFQLSAVRENTEILKRCDNGLKLAFHESLAIKEYAPELNAGIKSCKDLALF